MINYKEIKAKWTSGAATPDGIHLDRNYSIIKKDGFLHISDGNIEYLWDKFCITNFMSPTDKNIKWSDVDFEEFSESKIAIPETKELKNFKFNKK